MLDHIDPPDRAKLNAAYVAMSLIENGMRVGLGTGSTAAWLARLLGARRHFEDLDVVFAATSDATEVLARHVGLDVGELDDMGWLDLTIDGADEVDPMLTLIKGGGGALLREKIVARASERMVVIADEGKLVQTLGAFPLPVEVVRFASGTTEAMIGDVLDTALVGSSRTERRMRGAAPFLTDEHHYIFDLHLGRIDDVDDLNERLLEIPGVVETGLFIDIAEHALIGFPSGEVQVLRADEAPEDTDLGDEEVLEKYVDHIVTQGWVG